MSGTYFFNQKEFEPQFEANSGEMVTEPGQSFTTREIYERFLRTGRVEGMARPVIYDSDEMKSEPSFDDYDVTQDGSLDLSDVSRHRDSLTNSKTQRDEINRLSSLYELGKISYDDFCRLSSQQNEAMARPLIDYFGQKLAAKSAAQAKSKNETAASSAD